MGMAYDFPVNECTHGVDDRTITVHVFETRPEEDSYLDGGNSFGLERKTVNGVGIVTIIDRNSLFEELFTYDSLWNWLVNSEWFDHHPRVELYEDGFIADVFIRGSESRVVVQ
jgi:hypothetical protein